MAKFCQNCGKALPGGTKFCPGCGAKVAQPVPSGQAAPYAQEQQQPQYQQPRQQAYQNPQAQQSSQAQQSGQKRFTPPPNVYIPPEFAQRNALNPQPPQPTAEKPKKKRGKLLAAVSLLLVAAIVVGIFGFREGGWFRGSGGETGPDLGKVQTSEKGEVSLTSPSVTLCGVTVDVDTRMLKEGSRGVSVKVYDGGKDSDGSSYDAYELEMGEHGEFSSPVEVTFPCSVQADTDVVVEHFKDNEWVPLLSFVNESQKTVTAYFDSFSPARVSYRKVGDNPSLYYTEADEDDPYDIKLKVRSNYWEILKRTNPNEYSDEIKSFMGDPEHYAVELPKLDPKMDAKAAYEAFGEVNTMWTFFDAAINLGIETLPPSSQNKVVGFMIDHSSELGHAMNAIPFIAMATQVGFDLYMADSDTAAVNLYKNLIASSGTVYSLVTGYSHIGFTLMFVGVALFGMELDYFVDAAKQAKVENVRDVFNAYYTEIEPFDDDHWCDVFEDAYWKNDGKPEAAMRALKDAVDSYCSKFWTEVYNESNDDILFATTSAGYKKVFLDATDEQKTALTEQQKAKVWNLIQTKSMKKIRRFLTARLQENAYKEISKITGLYNNELYFTIRESVDLESTDVAKYKGCTVCLGSGDVPVPCLKWNIPDDPELDDGWDIDYDCTTLGYLKMGMADQVLVYASEDDYNSGAKPILTKSFKAVTDGDRRTVIELGNDTAPATGAPEWLEGAWSHTAGIDDKEYSEFSRESVRLTVIDEDTLLYEEYYYPNPGKPDWKYGVDYAFEREYYYDAKTDCVFILRTETGEFEGNVFPGVHDKGYLSPIRIERVPAKDSIHNCPATRFVQNPREITGDEKTESYSNLRFNRDKVGHVWTFNGTALPEPDTKGRVTEWTVKDDSVTIRIDGMSYDEYRSYCKTLEALPGWTVSNGERVSAFPSDYNDKDKVYCTGSYANLPRISAQYYSDKVCKNNGLPHFVIFVFTEW